MERCSICGRCIEKLSARPSNKLPGAPAWLELTLREPSRIDVVALQEAIADGQHVANYRVLGRAAGGGKTLSWGTTIGAKKLDRIDPVTVDAVRLEILSSFAMPRISALGIFGTT